MLSFERKICDIIEQSLWKDFVVEINLNYSDVLEIVKKKNFLKTAKYDYDYKKPLKILSCLIFHSEKDYSLSRIESQLFSVGDYYLTSFFCTIKNAKKNQTYECYNEIRQKININKNLCKFFEFTEAVFCGVRKLPPFFSRVEQIAEIFSLFFATSTKKEINIFNDIHEIDAKLMTAAQQVLQQSLIENWIVQLGGTIKQEKSKMIFYDGQRRLESIAAETFQFRLQRMKLYKKYIAGNETKLSTPLVQKLPRGNYGIAIGTNEPIKLMKLLQNAIYNAIYTPEEKAYICELFHELHFGKYFTSEFILKKYSPHDLITFRRLFFFLFIQFNDHLFSNKDISIFEKMHSLPLRVEQKNFERFLRILFKKDYTDLLKAITLDTKQKSCNHVDIQYTPFILDQGIYAIPLGLIAGSNFVRNVMVATNSHIEDLPGQPDVIDEEYQRFFPQRISGFSYSFNGVKGELDTVFKVDNTIFISENKNPVFGTSFIERKNTFDYADYAKDQRERFLKLWNDKNTKCNKDTFLDYFNKKIINYSNKRKIPIPFLADTSTDIVFFCTMGNRTAIWLSSRELHIIYIRQIISFLENQPIVFAGKNILRASFSKSRGLLSNQIDSITLKSFIEASDYQKVGSAFFAAIHKVT